jgi:Flp pilus assembly protein TadG
MPPFKTHSRRELIRRYSRSEDGTAAVEFAMCLPLLLVLLFFGIETSRLLIDFQAVSKSLRDSARYLSQVGINCPGTTASTGQLSTYIDNPAHETIARNLALTGTPDTPVNSSDYLLPYWTGSGNLTMTVSCVTNSTYQGIYDGAPLIPQLTVAAAVPFTFIWGTTFATTTGLTINLSHSQVHIGS